MSDDQIDKLLDDWHAEVGMQAFMITICRGELYQRLLDVGERLIPFILLRLRDFTPWMGYQYLLRNVSGVDIWQGKEMPNGYQAKQLCDSARDWLRWGKENDLIDSDTPIWKDDEI
jgi:hypothetical protein